MSAILTSLTPGVIEEDKRWRGILYTRRHYQTVIEVKHGTFALEVIDKMRVGDVCGRAYSR